MAIEPPNCLQRRQRCLQWPSTASQRERAKADKAFQKFLDDSQGSLSLTCPCRSGSFVTLVIIKAPFQFQNIQPRNDDAVCNDSALIDSATAACRRRRRRRRMPPPDAAAGCRRRMPPLGRLLLFVASRSMRQMHFKSSHLSASRDQHDHSLLQTAWWHDHPHSNIAYHLPALEFVRPIHPQHVSHPAPAPRVARPALFPARNYAAVQVLHHDRA
jgi:hypothetical protein